MIYRLRKILKESMPVLTMAAIISIFAGFIMNRNLDMFLALPGIIIIMPSFINTSGSLTSVLSSRLSSALHLGLVHPKLHKTKTLERNLISIYISAVISFMVTGIIAGLFNMFFGLETSFIFFALAVLIAGLSSVVLLSFLSVIFSYVSFGRGIDPDNWVIPMLTSIGDFVGIFFLFLMVSLFI